MEAIRGPTHGGYGGIAGNEGVKRDKGDGGCDRDCRRSMWAIEVRERMRRVNLKMNSKKE